MNFSRRSFLKGLLLAPIALVSLKLARQMLEDAQDLAAMAEAEQEYLDGEAVLFVHPDGNDAYDGLSPERPVQTLAEALSRGATGALWIQRESGEPFELVGATFRGERVKLLDKLPDDCQVTLQVHHGEDHA